MKCGVALAAKATRSSTRQSRDPEATKAEILEAAEEEFARFGLTGARTEAIAARTGVTKAMIYYYFGSKEDLYKAVLQTPVADFMAAVASLELEQLPAEEALKTVIRVAIAHELSHPNYGKVLLHEAMQNEGKYFRLTGWSTPINRLTQILERGVEDGSFRPLDPCLVMNHIMGICTFYFNAQANMRNVRPDYDWFSPEAIEKLTTSAVELVLAGLKP